LAAIFLLPLLLCTGCGDVFVFSDEGMVKRRIELLANAIGEGNWKKASGYFHQNFVWHTLSGQKKGAAASRAFLMSIKNTDAQDGFYINVGRVKKKGEAKVIASVTFQIHIIISSMALQYGNIAWRGQMLWVKQGVNEWKLAAIKDLSKRAEVVRKPGGV